MFWLCVMPMSANAKTPWFFVTSELMGGPKRYVHAVRSSLA